MGRERVGRREALALLGGLVLLPAAGGCTAGPGEGRDDAPPDRLRVRTDVEPVRRRLGKLGELSDPHWLGYPLDKSGEGERLTVPAHDQRVRLVGLARLPAGAVAATLDAAEEPFEAAGLPEVPEPLRPFLPSGADWRTSGAYDVRVLAPGPEKTVNDTADGRFFLERERDLVWFDAVFLS
ncbi:hypothetical protein [Streptomyces sp. NPDC012888]|uniref:hypothetical protein n=1 Tax=Streptomyces sp. NPDC012888 TaxID=3364855 RepID=UPI00368576D8